VIFIISTGRKCMREAPKDLALDTGSLELTMCFCRRHWNDHSASDRLWLEICDHNAS